MTYQKTSCHHVSPVFPHFLILVLKKTMERWMKERAAKSFGGPCMSRFVEESERKRIQRLHSIKSSIPGVIGKPRKIQKKNDCRSSTSFARKRNNERIDFQLRNLSGKSERTRSGLKVSVDTCDDDQEAKIQEYESRKLNAKEANKYIRMNTKKRSGKENCSPSSYKNKSNATKVKKSARLGKEKEEQEQVGKYSYKKCSYQNSKQTGGCRTKVLSMSAKTKSKQNRNRHSTRAVTIDSLEKEKLQAERFLKELDEKNLIARMQGLQMSMDFANTQRHNSTYEQAAIDVFSTISDFESDSDCEDSISRHEGYDDDYNDDGKGSFVDTTTISSKDISISDHDSNIESYNSESYSSNGEYQESWDASHCGSSFTSSYSEDSYECHEEDYSFQGN